MSTIPVNSSTWTAISAYYPYDDNIKINSVFVKWADGYSAYEHAAFINNVDHSFNRDTNFYLPTAKKLFDFISETGLDPVYQGVYAVFSIDAGPYFSPQRQFISTENSSLYLSPVSSDRSFYRFIINEDGTFSLFHGNGLYVTVDPITPFNLTMQLPLPITESYRQKFYWHYHENKIYFTIKTKNTSGIGPEYEERFWSFSKVGPEKGRMRASGFIPFNVYSDEMHNNRYLFDVEGFDVYYLPDGLIRDHTWVRYFNEFLDKENNRNVNINETRSTSGVFVSHLFDLPYKTQININNRNMGVNFANLKNIMTPEYEYRVKKNK